MKIFAPEYYGEFKCIADKCKNSCCIGWEIDIDKASLERYDSIEGDFGKRLERCICRNEGETHFILSDGERCPFLNENNLCDIFIELGEDSLCDICTDHPRFRNFYDSRTEIGMGLCCEAATELVLEWDKPFSLVEIDDDEETEGFDETEDVFFALREKVFEIISDESVSVDKCAERLAEAFGAELPQKSFEEWVDVFLDLEILDEEWINILKRAKFCKEPDSGIFESERGSNMEKQLLLYFIYRHTADGMYDGTFVARLAFAVLSVCMIKNLCAVSEKRDFETFKDIARRYSAEIEYCEENVERLIEMLMLR